MGGRGSSGAGGGNPSGWKLPTFTGSPKQVEWANDIATATFKNLDFMEQAIDRYVKDYGYRDDGKGAAQGYTKREIKEVRKYFQSAFEQPGMDVAKNVIERRKYLSRYSIEELAKEAFRSGKTWDKIKKKWV